MHQCMCLQVLYRLKTHKVVIAEKKSHSHPWDDMKPKANKSETLLLAQSDWRPKTGGSYSHFTNPNQIFMTPNIWAHFPPKNYDFLFLFLSKKNYDI
jgi:hypothetical protein